MSVFSKWLTGFIIVGFAFLCFGSGCEVKKNVDNTEEIMEKTVRSFDVKQFEDIIGNYSPEDLFGEKYFAGEVASPESAAEVAEKYWIEVFGEDTILQQRPYNVYFDKGNEIWLVTGNTDYLNQDPGGNANALIRKNDGEIIACWHTE